MKTKPFLSFWQIWNLTFGFLAFNSVSPFRTQIQVEYFKPKERMFLQMASYTCRKTADKRRTAICGSSTDGLDRKTGLKKILSFRLKQDLLRILSVPSPYQVLVSAKFATFAANLAKN